MSQKIVSFHYSLTNLEGQPLDSSEGGEPFTFMTESHQIIPGLEKELLQLPIGQ